MEELESMMYDRVDPKSIDEINYRHGINRGPILDQAAYHAVEGVEEEAEFSEFHAPALVKSSNEMNTVYQRLRREFEFVTQQMAMAKDRLAKADKEREKVERLVSRLYCRTQNSVLRTKYGFVKVKFYRVEDNVVVVAPLHWGGTIFIPIDEILAYEEMYKEEECFAMMDEDEQERLRLETRRKEMLAEERLCRKFYIEEIVLYVQERKAMANAEIEMREYVRQLEIEEMKTKYSKMVDDRNRINDKAARRQEIKLGKNEQHRLHREWRGIKEEDELSMKIRENERAEALAEALERQFDKYLADQAMQGKISADMEASRLAERLREAQQIAAEKRKAFEMKMLSHAEERKFASGNEGSEYPDEAFDTP
ncbi:hypothetical protein BBO99_00002349 [Phytophthora kernoviae]|uniref:Uncharacterized protein n=2 Tax=Phytophthora kernoviae TaxID=325452 RepID=A0A3R7J6J2_9STRA|nr:hypothetical protein G195_002843 [Phytophthora kernoviae 00238/432]KAG2529533.1 hypothetical protein JM16_002022 [Phytophthora kernoviae]KAG2530449.1 hypothetical protein JM18_002127 [Phytophthora kernoviae]RLN31313.1 hypothetical protein BBI17_002279 [Phytophthora kernoviae]RLN83158.1 hypothetical protein BBO99_00002349 [Phytophthora kernoviae]